MYNIIIKNEITHGSLHAQRGLKDAMATRRGDERRLVEFRSPGGRGRGESFKLAFREPPFARTAQPLLSF